MNSSSEQTGFTFSVETDQARNQFVIDRLREYNQAHSTALTPDSNSGHLSAASMEIYLLNNEQEIVGGLIGRTHSIPDWLEITVIWVDETWRKRGLGRQLIEKAEQEAQRRGCRYARLATGNYQAPDFYRKLGYILYGTLENCPPGVTVYYFRKDLETGAEQAVPPG